LKDNLRAEKSEAIGNAMFLKRIVTWHRETREKNETKEREKPREGGGTGYRTILQKRNRARGMNSPEGDQIDLLRGGRKEVGILAEGRAQGACAQKSRFKKKRPWGGCGEN